MSNTIVCDLKNITMNSKFLKLTTPRGEVEMDIKQLLSEPINSDRAYFNATDIARLYGKKFAQITRDAEWKEYTREMENMLNSKCANSAHLKLVKTVRGKHHSGTWLHSKLIILFLRRIDIKLAISMDLFLQDLIIHSNEIKIERDATKVLFKGLTKVIQDVYIPAQESDNAKKFAFGNISGLVNIKVLGCTGAKYAKDNGIDVDQGKSVRDYLTKEQLDSIKEVERVVSGMIEFGGVTDYEDLKNKI